MFSVRFYMKQFAEKSFKFACRTMRLTQKLHADAEIKHTVLKHDIFVSIHYRK